MSASAWTGIATTVLLAVLAGCAPSGSSGGWTMLVDGTKGMENFNRVGEANWAGVDGAIQATAGGKDASYLVSKTTYKNFMIRAEFWASDDVNSGIFMRCQDPARISDQSCYEANIFDQRPDPTYGTRAIVTVAKVAQPKWNTYEISAHGTHLMVFLNGVKTVDVKDSRLASGPIALQWGRGTIKFRKVEIRPL